MSRFLALFGALAVLIGAMGFAAANAGHRTTLDLGLFTLYQVPVTFVAFSGLFVGMVVMFVAGIRTDLKVRSILRERLKEEAQEEQTWIDKNQQDLFADSPSSEGAMPEEGVFADGPASPHDGVLAAGMASPGEPATDAVEASPEEPPLSKVPSSADNENGDSVSGVLPSAPEGEDTKGGDTNGEDTNKD